MAKEDLDKIKGGIPYQSPVQPVELNLDSSFQFDCHTGISCFNECCKNSDISLMPYDIVRLKRRFGLTSSEWVQRYTMPYPMDAHEMPGLKLANKPGSTVCVFLGEKGCEVYQDRPTACRYYALGSMGVRRENSSEIEDIYFLVKEDHCKGHDEERTHTVREYLKQQELDEYERMNREWRDVVLKKRSSGPTVGKPSERSLQLFDMCSYDIDNFREFVKSEGFKSIFDIDKETFDELMNDEDQLLSFAVRFLKQVLYDEVTIPVRDGAREQRLEKRRQRVAGTDSP